MIKDIFNVGKLNNEIKTLKGEIEVVTKDRDLQLAILKDFEESHKDYMQSAETFNGMQTKHKAEVATLNSTIESMKLDLQKQLSAKDIEVTQAKESMSKEIVAKSIAIVASQGTNIVIDPISPAVLSPEQGYMKLQSLTGEEKQKFYEANKGLFLTVLKNR